MGFKEVSSLDAENIVALGKKDKATGKSYPKQVEGYYLGSRTVENKRGESKIHFLQTPKGNLGVWGTTDLNRKLVNVAPGVMIRVTSTGTKPTPNGDMYVYKVEVDSDNTIEVSAQDASPAYVETEDDSSQEAEEEQSEDSVTDDLLRAQRAAKVQEILAKGKLNKTK